MNKRKRRISLEQDYYSGILPWVCYNISVDSPINVTMIDAHVIYQLLMLTHTEFLRLNQNTVHGLSLLPFHYNHNYPLSLHALKYPSLLMRSSLAITNRVRHPVSSATCQIDS